MVSSVYIHIPFCLSKCSYCDFYSIPVTKGGKEGMFEGYIDALRREIALRKDSAGELATVYIGGGTPTILSSGSIRGIMDSLRDSFSLSPAAEVTIEANPRTLTEEKAVALLMAGINRISIGVQSFRDEELQTLGRSHGSEDAQRAVETARAAGFASISLDLMYGIPGQGMDEWERSLTAAIAFRPEHISTYELTPEEGTPLHERLSRGDIVLPHEDIVVEMYCRSIDALGDAGYQHYEISNFALPGHDCRHNRNYWDRGEYLGLGAGAHSFIEGKRMENLRDVKGYIRSLSRGEIPVCNEMEISEDEALREFLFLGLRKTEGIDLGRIPVEMRRTIKEAMEEPVLHGLVSLKGDRLSLTIRGLLLSNSVIVQALLRTDSSLP